MSTPHSRRPAPYAGSRQPGQHGRSGPHSQHGQPRRSLPNRRMAKVYRRRRQTAAALIIVFLLLIVGVMGIGVRNVVNAWKNVGPADFEGTGNGTAVLVEVPQGSSLSQLGPELVSKNVVASDAAFQSAAVSTTNTASLQPGFYRLEEEMSAKSAVEALLNGEGRGGVVDIPNGLTLMDVKVVGGDTRFGIYSLLSKSTCQVDTHCKKPEEFMDAATKTPSAELGVPEWARGTVDKHMKDPKRLEGLIRPGVHSFDPSQDAAAILKKLVTESVQAYEKTGLLRQAQAVKLSPYELLTAASLVEREAPAGDFDKVARVILNRLAEPMRLEFDSTVNYDLSEVEVATTDADRARKTPWNTYARDGLPATPIASPSEKALLAMEHPAQGDWLFFVTVDKNGRTVFNHDFDAHQKATQESIDNGVLDSGR